MVRHSWRTELKNAGGVEAVLDVVRRFLAEWKPEEIASLPAGGWPKSIGSRKAVQDNAFRLFELHAAFEGDTPSLARLQELLLFLTHVSVRITQVERLGANGSAVNATSFTGASEPMTPEPRTGEAPRKKPARRKV